MRPIVQQSARRVGRGALRLLLVLACATAEKAAASPGTAYRAYQKGEFPVARSEYERLSQQNPDDPRYKFNAGAAAYRQKDWTNAAAWFESVLANPDLDLQQQANYNLGNTRFRLGESMADPQGKMKEWESSIGHFEAATKLNPGDTNAIANLQFARQKLEELRQQQPPPPKGGQNDKDKDKKQQPPKDSKDSSHGASKKDSGKNPSKPSDSKKGDSGDDASGQQAQDQQKTDSGTDTGSQQAQSQGEKKEESSPDGKDGQASGGGKPGESKPMQPGDRKPDANGNGEGASVGEMDAEENAKPGEMSALQAKRLLDSQKGEEKPLVFRAHGGGKESREETRTVRRPW